LAVDKNAIIRDAQRYTARGQIDKAIAEWQKLLKETPNDGNIYNTIGDLYLKIKAQKEAVESYRKAAGIFQRGGFTLKAIALYKKIININPHYIDALLCLAELNAERGLIGNANENYLAIAEYYTKEGSVSKALEIYERMVNLNPNNMSLRLKLADMYIKEGFPEDGINKYLESAHLYIEKGEIQKAKEIYNKVIAYRPKNLDALKGLCSIYQKEGDFKGAYEIIKKAVELYPEREDLLLLYGRSALHADRLDEAKDTLLKILNAEPENEDARRCLAGVYLKEGNKDLSLEELKKVLDGLIKRDELEGATALLQEMIDIEPESPDLHHNLIDIYRRLGKEEEIKREYELLASIYINQGDSEKATNILKTLIVMDPANNGFRRMLEEMEREVTEKAEVMMEEMPSEEGPPEKPEVKDEEGVLTEADVYMRYGLVDKAIETLKAFLDTTPESIKAHIRLKDLFKTQGMKDRFIEECLTLSDIYQKEGMEEDRLHILNEAIEMEPGDERVLERIGAQVCPGEVKETAIPEVGLEEGLTAEALEERIAEADFYAQQGIVKEAIKLYEGILKLQPENEDIRRKIEALSGIEERLEEITFVKEEPEAPAPKEEIAEEISMKEGPEIPAPEEAVQEKAEGVTFMDEAPETMIVEEPHEEFIDFATELKEELEAEAPGAFFHDKNLQEIFQEFKKGVDREVGEDDYDTHYNLGIAYKEMGLIDDAIGEFQAASKSPSRYLQASSMLGLCFMEKGLYHLAIKEFKKAIEAVEEGTEEYMGLKYDLGNAYEKAGMLDEALNIYTDIYGMDAKFREVTSRIERIKRMVGTVVYPEKKVKKTKKDRVSYL